MQVSSRTGRTAAVNALRAPDHDVEGDNDDDDNNDDDNDDDDDDNNDDDDVDATSTGI